MLYDEKSLQEVLDKININDIGTYIIYYNDINGTFNIGLYTTGTVESDEFYKHNHEICRSISPSDLSVWLGCFECGKCSYTEDDETDKMEKCFRDQIENDIDFDIIRESVKDVMKSKLQTDMDLILEIIGLIYEKYYPTGKFLQWTYNDYKYYETTAWDYILEGLEENNVKYYTDNMFNRQCFNNDVYYITENLTLNIPELKKFREYMENYKFEEAIKEIKEI